MRHVWLCLVLGGSAAGCEEPVEEVCEPTVTIEATPPLLSSGELLQITVDVRDFTLLDPAGDEDSSAYARNCAGHYHAYLDKAEGEPLAEGIEEAATFPVVAAPGEHELIVQLRGSDEVGLIPDASDTATITIKE